MRVPVPARPEGGIPAGAWKSKADGRAGGRPDVASMTGDSAVDNVIERLAGGTVPRTRRR